MRVHSLHNFAAGHGVSVHAYADDMQTYASCAAPDQQSEQTATDRILACVADIDSMDVVYAEKIEFIWLSKSAPADGEGHCVSINCRLKTNSKRRWTKFVTSASRRHY